MNNNSETTGAPCPKCGGCECRTTDSRPVKMVGVPSRKRRRQCSKCSYRFTTYELTADLLDAIEKRLEAFDRLEAAMRQVMALETRIRVRPDV